MCPEPGSGPDVAICIVSFNTRDLLAACLHSVYESQGVTFDVHVVDNGSSDGSAEMVAREFPRVHLVRNPVNAGFAAANNLVIQPSAGRYVLLLNPDTVVRPGTLAQMVRFMDAHQETAVCGPRILYGDGRFQSCGYRFPTLMGEIRQSKNVDKVLRRLIGEEPVIEVRPEPFEVEWVDGACFLMRRETIDQIGALDEQFFLYAEELDWCYRARQAGWRIFALPHVEMVHYQGQSSSQISDFSLALLVETRLRYYRKHHGVPMATVTSLVYVAGCLKQLGRDEHKARVKLRATAHWWRTMLAA